MLEHVLRKERAQHSSSGDATAPPPFIPGPTSTAAAVAAAAAAANSGAASVGGKKIKEGRQILFQYLKEMGYADQVIHVRLLIKREDGKRTPPMRCKPFNLFATFEWVHPR